MSEPVDILLAIVPSSRRPSLTVPVSRAYGSGFPGTTGGLGVGNRNFPFVYWPLVWGGGLGYGAAYLHTHEVSHAFPYTHTHAQFVTTSFSMVTRITQVGLADRRHKQRSSPPRPIQPFTSYPTIAPSSHSSPLSPPTAPSPPTRQRLPLRSTVPRLTRSRNKPSSTTARAVLCSRSMDTTTRSHSQGRKMLPRRLCPRTSTRRCLIV